MEFNSANTEARHKPTQKFNRYRTIDQPPSESNTVFRPRYSFKTRQRTKTHDPPKALKQYEYKVPKDPVKSPEDGKSTSTTSSKRSGIKPPLPTNTLKRKDLLKALTWEHPTSALDVGTLHKNVEYALGESHAAREEIIKVIRRAVRVASKEKRRCQRLIAKYIQLIVSPENFHDDDRVILTHLCPSSPCNSGSSIENNEEDEQDADDTDIDDSSGKQEQFLLSLMISLYSQNKPLGKIANVVNTFINRLEDLKLLPQRQQSRVGALKKKPEFPSGALLRSVSVQMCAELERHYKVGCEKLLEKLTKQQEKGLLPAESRVEVRNDVSAIENFAYLNKLANNTWRLAPLSPVKNGFVFFSELELIAILWQSPILKPLIQNLYTLTSGVPSLEVIQKGLEPGRMINALLCKVGIDGLSWSQRKKAGIRAAIEIPASSKVVAHVNTLREPAFDPRTYNGKGYFMRPSISTNGFRLFLLAFKKKELQSVRFRRYPDDVLPNRLLSTIGGTDSFLTEIRNVIQSPDIQEYLGNNPDRVKILGLDLGQACTVAASTLLPQDASASEQLFLNLAVKSKAIYQPNLKHRRWMERRKHQVLPGSNKTEEPEESGQSEDPEQSEESEESIADIESNLPSLRGKDSCCIKYCEELELNYQKLDSFYNSDKYLFERHDWDVRRAKQEEFRTIADRLLQSVGGSLRKKRDEDNKVVIAVGLGKFQTKSGMTSLHDAFAAYFVKTARSLGYLVVGVNEFYTSKKCPVCTNFVGQVTIRRLYCRTCRAYLHRDVMAAQNMCNIVQGYLLKRGRPEYLQPKSIDGTYLWTTAISEASSSANLDPTTLEQASGTEPSAKDSSKTSVFSCKKVASDSELEEQVEELTIEPKKQWHT